MLFRATVRGFAAGALSTALALILFPHFYGRLFELLVFPAAGALAGVVVGLLVLLVRAVRRRPAREARSGAGLSRALMFWLTVSIALPVLMYAVRTPARNWRVAPRLVVLCLDGGTWDLIDPLIQSGQMPNLSRLKRDGVSGMLMSTDPSFSPVVWTTIGTGVLPETHGINSFYSTQDYLQSKRVWDVLEENGHSIGMFRWLVTWPPHATNGFIVPGILAQDAECFPSKYNFVNQLRMDKKLGRSSGLVGTISVAWRFMRAGLRMETCLDIAQELWPALRSGQYVDFHIAARRAEIRLNADVYCHLLREAQPEFTCFYDNGADVLCHYYWHYYEPELFKDVDPAGVERYGSVISDYYALNDRVFGRIVDHLEPTSNVMVLSDHGHTADTDGAKRAFYPRSEPVLEALGMKDEFYGIALGSKMFIESVKADADEKRAALAAAVDAFNSVTTQEGNVRVFNAEIHDDDRVLLTASEELADLSGTVLTDAGVVKVEDWFLTKAMTGTHEPEGIYLLRGPAFRAGTTGPNSNLVDVAPTLLYLAGLPLSRELEGGVVWEAFTDAFRAENETAWVDTYGHFDPLRRDLKLDEETMKKLRALGYVR
jgi:predicted AlkP superfamily phosphohydrolase/phosphomutase